jgi:hypothetical protein
MPHYVGLDVSMKETKLHVLDEAGQRVWRGRCAFALTDDAEITAVIMPLLQARQMARGKCAALDRRIIRSVQGDATCRMLMTMPGIGPITAVAYVAPLEKPDTLPPRLAVPLPTRCRPLCSNASGLMPVGVFLLLTMTLKT